MVLARHVAFVQQDDNPAGDKRPGPEDRDGCQAVDDTMSSLDVCGIADQVKAQ